MYELNVKFVERESTYQTITINTTSDIFFETACELQAAKQSYPLLNRLTEMQLFYKNDFQIRSINLFSDRLFYFLQTKQSANTYKSVVTNG